MDDYQEIDDFLEEESQEIGLNAPMINGSIGIDNKTLYH